MSYLYQLIRNTDSDKIVLFDGIKCNTIVELAPHRNKTKYPDIFEARYYSLSSGVRLNHKFVYREEGKPYMRTMAFWLRERNDNKARKIFIEAMKEKADKLKQTIDLENSRLKWEHSFIGKLNTMEIID